MMCLLLLPLNWCCCELLLVIVFCTAYEYFDLGWPLPRHWHLINYHQVNWLNGYDVIKRYFLILTCFELRHSVAVIVCFNWYAIIPITLFCHLLRFWPCVTNHINLSHQNSARSLKIGGNDNFNDSKATHAVNAASPAGSVHVFGNLIFIT